MVMSVPDWGAIGERAAQDYDVHSTDENSHRSLKKDPRASTHGG
jgi:hypothetical protein